MLLDRISDQRATRARTRLTSRAMLLRRWMKTNTEIVAAIRITPATEAIAAIAMIERPPTDAVSDANTGENDPGVGLFTIGKLSKVSASDTLPASEVEGVEEDTALTD